MDRVGLALIKRANARIRQLREHRRELMALRLGKQPWEISDTVLDSGC